MSIKIGKLLKQSGLLLAAGLMAVSAHAQNKLDPLKVRLDWTPWGVQVPFHLAKEKGWYEAAGLDVTLEDGNGSVTTVQIVGNSDDFDVGHAGLATMAIARDKGLPVKAVALFLRKSDLGVMVPVESDVKGPADLKGKNVIYTAGSLEAPFIDHFLAKGNITRRDMDLVSVEAASKIASYSVGRADGVVTTIPGVLAYSAAKGRPSRAIPFADYGLNVPSFGIFTSEKKLAEKADAISRFASVTARAWEYIFDGNQEEAAQAMLAQRPQARLDPTILQGEMDALELFFGDRDGQRVGVIVPADWEEAVKNLRAVDLIGDKLAAEELYVTDMVYPEKYDHLASK